MNWLNDNVNLLSLIGAAAIILITAFVAGKYIKQMKTDKSTGELAEENWDGIGEYKNPLPIGWAVSFLGLIIWAIWYFLAGYPLNGYSQIGEYNEEVAAYNTKFESKWANPDEDTLMGMGEGVFLVQCAPCHGITGDGINGKATDLTSWGPESAIVNTIAIGAKGSGYPLGEMPAGLLDPESAKAVAAYMVEKISKAGPSKNPDLVSTGEALWATCSACHGEDGKGMAGSSPDISNYGKPEFIVNVLNRGKKGMIGSMPSFNDGRLTDIQKFAVGKYVNSLSQ
ncbi:cbb3-type cytochrome c oxidase N-terminal domain-containing protein [Sulfurospirillum arcachonense]|uniref:cbb3-type cytochrome c oxidase N-terminal domain-containing protein n=1 Tax=Sulfurospirillum arcachonense TaxID=57666 RepID=UPI0004686A14|nr:cbb3-type cytochrome c oxidase N-terminal domain-containing protein [Sulfurospirillum arcachonense]